jgi:hypothetical protein
MSSPWHHLGHPMRLPTLPILSIPSLLLLGHVNVFTKKDIDLTITGRFKKGTVSRLHLIILWIAGLLDGYVLLYSLSLCCRYDYG